MEWVEFLESSLGVVVAIAQLCLETISVGCVTIGLVQTLRLAVKLNWKYRSRGLFPFNEIRLRFGRWLALALEFQLGADILGTTLSPNIQELGKLTVIALVRTFLNYFLGKELEREIELDQKRNAQTPQAPHPDS